MTSLAYAENKDEDCTPELAGTGLPSKTEDPTGEIAAARIRMQQAALRTLRDELPYAFPPRPAKPGEVEYSAEAASLGRPAMVDIKTKPFFKVLDRLLIKPGVEPSDVVTIAFGGPARMGKSTLVNFIRELSQGKTDISKLERITPSGRRGGTTKRALIVLPRGSGEAYERRRREVEARYPGMKPLVDPEDMLQDGPALFIEIDGLENFPNLVFLDTPDITTGDRRTTSQPIHLEKARDALLAADFIIFLLNDDNLQDLRLSELIAEGFHLYGRRNTAFILRTDAVTEKEYRDSRDWLIDATRRFYSLAGEGGVPTFVKGLFAMPIDKMVKAGEKLPELEPLANGSTFPALLSDLANNSAEIRGVAGREAAKSLYRDIESELNEAFTHHSASEIYQMALEMVAKLAPPIVHIPYAVNAKDWREQLSERNTGLEKIVDKGAKVSAGIGEGTKNKIPLINSGTAVDGPSFAETVQSTDDQVKASWNGHLAGLIRELQQGKVTLPKAEAERLLAKVKAANSQLSTGKFPEVLEAQGKSGLATVYLPNIKMLSGSARDAMKSVFAASQVELMGRLTTTVDRAEVATLTEENIDAGFKRIHESGYPLSARIRDALANVSGTVTGAVGAGGPIGSVWMMIATMWQGTGTAAAGTAAAGVVTSGVTFATFFTPAAICASTYAIGFGGAMIVRAYLDTEMDRSLKPALDDWFTNLQIDSFRTNLQTNVFKPVNEALFVDAPSDRIESLRKVRNALAVLMSKSSAPQGKE